MNNKARIRIVSFLLVGIVVFSVYIYLNNVILISKTDLNNEVYGIIDDSLSKEIDNVIYIKSDYNSHKTESHGEKLCDFANNNYKNFKIYYFSAEVDGKINSKSIIRGLNELINKNVKKINISLSSKIYSDDLQNWIREHKDIKIYASYNNRINTYDYPAMYEEVIASGEYNEITKFKEIDVKYRSQNIIGLTPLKKYSGNSFLSLVSMFDNK